MSKILAVMIAGLFAAGAYAQGTSQEAAPQTNTPSQQKAQAKRDAKPKGVRAQGGDSAKTPEGSGGLTSGKSVDAGDARQKTRDDRHRTKSGAVKPKSTQGGTPNN